MPRGDSVASSFCCERVLSRLTFVFMGMPICLGQLRSHPSGYLDEVSAGRTLEVIRRGRHIDVATLISFHTEMRPQQQQQG